MTEHLLQGRGHTPLGGQHVVFVALPVVALYQDWRPFLISIVFVVLHHGFMTMFAPNSVFHHADIAAHPINAWRTPRARLEDYATFSGF